MSIDLVDTRIFAKSAIATALTGKRKGAPEFQNFVTSRWPGQGIETRAAVGDIGSADVNSTALGADVLRHVVKESVIGPMLRDMWKVAFQQPFNSAATGLSANWVSELRPAPISRTSLSKETLPRLKVSAISVFTDEALQHEYAEIAIERALMQTCRDVIDEAFLSGSGFAGEVPGSVPQTASVVSVAATGDPAASFRALMRNFGGQLGTSYLITDHETAAQLALYPNSPFLDAGVRGGSVAGLPLVVSQSSPRDSAGGQVVLLDASRVAIALGTVEVSRSNEASIMMEDAFDSNGSGEMVSLFQNDAQALKISITANWKLMDSSGCRILTGADW